MPPKGHRAFIGVCPPPGLLISTGGFVFPLIKNCFFLEFRLLRAFGLGQDGAPR